MNRRFKLRCDKCSLTWFGADNARAPGEQQQDDVEMMHLHVVFHLLSAISMY